MPLQARNSETTRKRQKPMDFEGKLAYRNETSIHDLNLLLANEFAVFTKTLNYHWNVEGPGFTSLHELLENQYRELLEIVDNVAERMRKLDSNACGTLKEFQNKSTIPERPGEFPDPPMMLDDLCKDHQTLRSQILTILEKKGPRKVDRGTEDFLTGLIRQHEDMIWRLRSNVQ